MKTMRMGWAPVAFAAALALVLAMPAAAQDQPGSADTSYGSTTDTSSYGTGGAGVGGSEGGSSQSSTYEETQSSTTTETRTIPDLGSLGWLGLLGLLGLFGLRHPQSHSTTEVRSERTAHA